MKKNAIFLILALTALTSQAKERSSQELATAASEVLNRLPGVRKGLQRERGTDTPSTLRVLVRNSQLTVMGYDGGGFAVMANDDSYEAVIGYADTTFDPAGHAALQ